MAGWMHEDGGLGPGIYVHVPFCLRRCFYCDFNVYRFRPAEAAPFLAALRKEMALYAAAWPDGAGPVRSLFIGGGTPTLLSGRQLAEIAGWVRELFPVAAQCEVSVEANPDTLDPRKLAEMREAGINRLSVGVQVLDDALLRRLGRTHSAGTALAALQWAREAGFDNLNVDVMFGLPGQTLTDLDDTLDRLLALVPEHLSCYSLILEERTTFHKWHRQGKLELPGEARELAMYERAIERCKRAGLRHYEISNFARPGRECRHNLVYWHNGQWLGLGPGGHSHWQGSRFANVRRPQAYRARLEAGQLPIEWREAVSRDDEMDETMILGLRLIDGVSVAAFRQRFGVDPRAVYREAIEKLSAWGLLAADDEAIRLTPTGLPVANRAFAEFLREPAP